MRLTGNAAQLEYRCELGSKLLEQGKGVREVARWLELGPSLVSRWKQALKRGRKRALQPKPYAGLTLLLSGARTRLLIAMLLVGPCAAGYTTELWTYLRAVEVIWQQFGVYYHRAHV